MHTYITSDLPGHATSDQGASTFIKNDCPPGTVPIGQLHRVHTAITLQHAITYCIEPIA